jgi:hypothetical protein
MQQKGIKGACRNRAISKATLNIFSIVFFIHMKSLFVIINHFSPIVDQIKWDMYESNPYQVNQTSQNICLEEQYLINTTSN